MSTPLHEGVPTRLMSAAGVSNGGLMSRGRPYQAALLALALVIRLAYILEIKNTVVFSVLVGDGYVYDQWAQDIARGNWLGGDVFYQTPLYPYFLASIFALLGHSVFLVRLIQIVGGASACVFLALAGRAFFSARVGLLAGLLLAVYSPAIFFEGLIQKAALDMCLTCLLLLLLGQLLSGVPRSWLLLATGCVLGLLSLNRENALALIIPVSAWVVIQFRSTSLPRRLAWVGTLLAGVGLSLAPVVARNLVVGGEVFLTTAQFGPNFFIGNNEGATGQYGSLRWGRGSALTERQDATELAEAAEGRPLTPGEVSRYWTRRATDYIVAHPRAWVRLMVKKCLLVWNRKELTDSEDPAIYADYSSVLRVLARFVHFGVIAPLALLGICTTWKDRRRLWLLHLVLVSMTGAVALFYVFARYRYPLVPVLLLFAAAAIWSLLDSLRGQQLRRLMGAVAVLAAAAVLVNWEITPPDAPRATTYYNFGVTLAMEGRVDDAVGFYSKALAVDPGFVDARVMLGNALISLNRLDEAVREFQAVLRQMPSNALVHNNLAVALGKQGNAGLAAHHFREALRLQPDFPGARAGLARISP